MSFLNTRTTRGSSLTRGTRYAVIRAAYHPSDKRTSGRSKSDTIRSHTRGIPSKRISGQADGHIIEKRHDTQSYARHTIQAHKRTSGRSHRKATRYAYTHHLRGIPSKRISGQADGHTRGIPSKRISGHRGRSYHDTASAHRDRTSRIIEKRHGTSRHTIGGRAYHRKRHGTSRHTIEAQASPSKQADRHIEKRHGKWAWA